MSDPVSNAEIEDVLSSIRRLVSVDSRAEPRKDPAAAEVNADAKQHEKTGSDAETAQIEDNVPQEEARLVLTPSFRVKTTGEEADHPTSRGEPQDAAEGSDAHLTLEQWQVAVDTPEDERAERADSESAYHEDDPQEDVAELDPAPGQAEVADAAAARDSADDVDEVSWSDDADDDEHAQDENWQLAEEAEREVAETPEFPSREDTPDMAEEPDGEIASEPPAFRLEKDEGFDFVKPSADANEEQPEEEDASDAPDRSELEARIAEVEAAVAARDDQWEPDGASEDEYAGGRTDPLPWEDHVEPKRPDDPEVTVAGPEGEDEEPLVSASAEPSVAIGAGKRKDEATDSDLSEDEAAPAAGATPPDRQKDRFTADAAPKSAEPGETWYREEAADAILDEDALRDLVSEIVRQELQGTLGERITRNVRKLVRREIHRAMMGQDFD